MRVAVVAAVLSSLATSALDPAQGVRAKLQLIQGGRAHPGSTFVFTASELNAYARSELPRVVPEGLRQPRLELGSGSATGYALIDFVRLRHGEGVATPWLIGKLIEGERPVKVNARIVSGNGHAAVYLDRVEISGLTVNGSTLDFLIGAFLLPLYPNAKLNRTFELEDRVDRIEIAPAEARVILKR